VYVHVCTSVIMYTVCEYAFMHGLDLCVCVCVCVRALVCDL